MTQPTIHSSNINKCIKQRVWPLLKISGFEKFTSRNAWRLGNVFQMVNFQSFNSYTATALGCTTFSFSVNLGLHFDFMPQGGGSERFKPNHPPHEAQCIFRKQLRRTLQQLNNFHPGIWAVDPMGLNIDSCISDAINLIERDALPWFAELSDLANALRVVETVQEEFDKFGPTGTWGFGRPGSPMRMHAISYLQNALSSSR